MKLTQFITILHKICKSRPTFFKKFRGGEDVEGEGEVGRLARGAGGVDAGGDDDGEQQRLAEDGDERRRGGVQVRELLGMMTSTGAVVSRG